MMKTVQTTINLPESVFAAVERERYNRGETRDEFFRRAAETLLRRQRERQMIEEYVVAHKETKTSNSSDSPTGDA